jgi:CDP-6-deoxy-D-xylo-4-hexulose-3-dehydrase
MTPRDSADTYPLAADTIGEAEISAAKEVLDSGRLTMGGKVLEFERSFARWVGAEHAVMVNSGSSANLLIADSISRNSSDDRHLVPGDEVIVPALAWPTTVWPLSQAGLIPVFVDVDPETLAIDLGHAEAAIGPRTRAMFLIHPLGQAADLKRYASFCEDAGLELIEDCCESLGAFSGRHHVGTAGLAGSFSFYFSHHLTTIEGGMVVTNDARRADDLRGLRAHGWVRDRSDRKKWSSEFPDIDERFLFATLGYNLRPTEIQAAIGLVQLGRLDEMLAAREALATRVSEWLAESAPWLELVGSNHPREAPPDRAARRHSWMTLPMRIAGHAPMSMRAVMNRFEMHGVETRPIIAGNLARHPATQTIAHRVGGDLSVADQLLRDGLMIGCHPVIDEGRLSTLHMAVSSLAA